MGPKHTPARGIDQLEQVVTILRRDCPWNRRQSARSLVEAARDELDELLLAVDDGETWAVRDEVGDVLFNLVSLLKAYGPMTSMHMDDVAAQEAEKMRRRHPYVFGEQPDPGPDGAIEQWAEAKLEERTRRLETVSALCIHGSVTRVEEWTFVPEGIERLGHSVLSALGDRQLRITEQLRSAESIVAYAEGGQTTLLVIGLPVMRVLLWAGIFRGGEVPSGWANDLRGQYGSDNVWVVLSEVNDDE